MKYAVGEGELSHAGNMHANILSLKTNEKYAESSVIC